MAILRLSVFTFIFLASWCASANVKSTGERFFQNAQTAFAFTAVELGAELMQKAAEAGHTEAQANLAFLHISGMGVEESLPRAAYWMEQAATKGDLPAQFRYGLMLERGEGTDRSYEEAAYWYKAAAERGHPEARFALGRLYYRGLGVPWVFDYARVHFDEAAKQGEPRAEFALYFLRNILFGHEPEYVAGINLLISAAERGYGPAAYALAHLHLSGALASPGRGERYLRQAIASGIKHEPILFQSFRQ